MRTKDRLAELRQRAGAGADAGAGPGEPPPHPPDIELILREAEQLRGWVGELQRGTRLMRRLHADPACLANTQLQEQLDAAATHANAVGLKLCGALRQFEERVTGAGGSGGLSGRGGAAARIAQLQLAGARRGAADALAQLHALLDAARDAQRRLLRDQLRLADMTISDEECENLLDSNNISVFVDNVQAETAEARRQLREAEARRGELARVEAALRDLRDLFAALAHLVAQQQDQVDSVEYYALQAGEHVGGGGAQLLAGSVRRRGARQKKVSLVICLLVGFGIVLLVLVLT